jgi:hypothetical protein
MQLRTPLRVLVRHGEVHRDMNSPPPQIANELWEGIWRVKTKTWKELGGADIPDFMATTIASDIGPIPNDGKNLEFLIAVRTVVEAPASIDSRIEQLREVAAQAEWQDFVGRNGGISSIIERFFPYFIATIPTLSPNARDKLYHMRLNTPEKLSTVSDETLLSIKGIGPAKLRIIREYCNSIEHNRDVEMVDQVVR